MSIQELQKQIQNAVFLTAKQKAALLTVVPGLSEAQQTQLEDFLRKSHKDLSKLRKKQAHEWIDLMKINLQKIKSSKLKGMNQIEKFDQKEEESELDDLLNQL